MKYLIITEFLKQILIFEQCGTFLKNIGEICDKKNPPRATLNFVILLAGKFKLAYFIDFKKLEKIF